MLDEEMCAPLAGHDWPTTSVDCRMDKVADDLPPRRPYLRLAASSDNPLAGINRASRIDADSCFHFSREVDIHDLVARLFELFGPDGADRDWFIDGPFQIRFVGRSNALLARLALTDVSQVSRGPARIVPIYARSRIELS